MLNAKDLTQPSLYQLPGGPLFWDQFGETPELAGPGRCGRGHLEDQREELILKIELSDLGIAPYLNTK